MVLISVECALLIRNLGLALGKVCVVKRLRLFYILPFRPFSASFYPLVSGAVINLCAKRTTLFSLKGFAFLGLFSGISGNAGNAGISGKSPIIPIIPSVPIVPFINLRALRTTLLSSQFSPFSFQYKTRLSSKKILEILKILHIITKKFIIFVMVLQLQIDLYDITC